MISLSQVRVIIEDKECDSRDLGAAFHNSKKADQHFCITRYEQVDTIKTRVSMCHKVALYAVLLYINRITEFVASRNGFAVCSSVSHNIDNLADTKTKNSKATYPEDFLSSLQTILEDSKISNLTQEGFDVGQTLNSKDNVLSCPLPCTDSKMSLIVRQLHSGREGRDVVRGGGGGGGASTRHGDHRAVQSAGPPGHDSVETTAGSGGGGGVSVRSKRKSDVPQQGQGNMKEKERKRGGRK